MASDPCGFNPENPERFSSALRRFDEENARDPNLEQVDGESQPRELIYSKWLSQWVLKLCPDADEALRLAARCQHICRWMSPRESYPMTRAGYLKWREDLKHFHARKAGEILAEVGYPQELIRRVQDLNLKKNFPSDLSSQVLEDALCLVFLEKQLSSLAAKTSPEKVVQALQKSWKKMSPKARDIAMTLQYGGRERALIHEALGS